VEPLWLPQTHNSDMNINEPTNSRILAELIQVIPGDERMDFIAEARKAKDMDSFIKQFMESNSKDK
jgi:hypothetical protein